MCACSRARTSSSVWYVYVCLRSAAVRPKLSLSLSQFGGEGNPKSKQHREEKKKKNLSTVVVLLWFSRRCDEFLRLFIVVVVVVVVVVTIFFLFSYKTIILLLLLLYLFLSFSLTLCSTFTALLHPTLLSYIFVLVLFLEILERV